MTCLQAFCPVTALMLPEVDADLTVTSSPDTGKHRDSSGVTLSLPVPPRARRCLPSPHPSSLRPGVASIPPTEGLNLGPVGGPGPRLG